MTETIDRDKLRDIYTRTMRVARADEKFRSLLMTGKLAVIYYTVRGQELVSAAAMAALEQDDYLVTTYRGQHDQIAKGVPLNPLFAEIAGKVGGTCRGKGGSMHITHPDSGVMVTTGVVGSGLPIANGLALASQNRGDGKVTIVCFGDGATNIGAFHEAMNMAQLWKLPVIFLCQNNRYGEHTAYAASTSAKQIIDRAPGYSMEAVKVDGNNPIEMYSAAKAAVDRARAGEGPTLIEAMTYRMLGHTFGADFSYVPKELQEEAKANDPIPAFRTLLLDRGVSEEEIAAIEATIDAELDAAVEHALSSEYPGLEELRIDVLKEEIRA